MTPVVHVALGMVPSSGGTVLAVREIQAALGSRVISFTSQARLQAEGSAIAGALHVPLGSSFWETRFAWPPAAALRPADELAQTASLLSCHMLYRYHAHWVGAWARRRRIPYWVFPHGSLDPFSFQYRPWFKRAWLAGYGRRFLAGATHVVFSTLRERRLAAHQYDGPNVRVVLEPVTPPGLERAAELRQRTRQRLGLAEDERLLLCLGRLHSVKRPLETVAALAAAARPRVRLAVVGPDETITAREVLAEAEKLGLRGRVFAPGSAYGEAKDEWLHACDGFISLSWMESFGHSVAEAIAAHQPAILAPGIGLVEELAPHQCGWFLPDNSAAAATAAIQAWADAPAAQLHAMGARGSAFVRGELTFAKFAAHLRDLAQEALAVRS
jgi:glycosyltransferase involved in cell wall biosynthesis